MFSFTRDHFQIVVMPHSRCRLKLNCHHVAHRRTAPIAAGMVNCSPSEEWVKLSICMMACINQDKLDYNIIINNNIIIILYWDLRCTWHNLDDTWVIWDTRATVVSVVAINTENKRLNLSFIHWSKEDLKQQDLMKRHCLQFTILILCQSFLIQDELFRGIFSQISFDGLSSN